MAKITKLVANKRSITRTIVSSVAANHELLGERLEQTLFDGQPPVPLTMADVAKAITAQLSGTYETLEERDREVATETAQDRFKRSQRDQIVTRLRQRLISLRGAVEADFGSQAAAHLGMIGNTPEAPDQLITHTNNVLQRMDDGLGDFEPLLPELARPDYTPRTTSIAQDVSALVAAMASLDQDIRETQTAQNQRTQALEQWTKNYSPVASILEGLYRLVDMPAHADRVRPTTRRRAGVPEPEDIENEPVADDVLDTDDHEEAVLDA